MPDPNQSFMLKLDGKDRLRILLSDKPKAQTSINANTNTAPPPKAGQFVKSRRTEDELIRIPEKGPYINFYDMGVELDVGNNWVTRHTGIAYDPDNSTADNDAAILAWITSTFVLADPANYATTFRKITPALTANNYRMSAQTGLGSLALGNYTLGPGGTSKWTSKGLRFNEPFDSLVIAPYRVTGTGTIPMYATNQAVSFWELFYFFGSGPDSDFIKITETPSYGGTSVVPTWDPADGDINIFIAPYVAWRKAVDGPPVETTGTWSAFADTTGPDKYIADFAIPGHVTPDETDCTPQATFNTWQFINTRTRSYSTTGSLLIAELTHYDLINRELSFENPNPVLLADLTLAHIWAFLDDVASVSKYNYTFANSGIQAGFAPVYGGPLGDPSGYRHSVCYGSVVYRGNGATPTMRTILSSISESETPASFLVASDWGSQSATGNSNGELKAVIQQGDNTWYAWEGSG